MTAVCKEVRKKTIELITRIKQKLKGSMSIITKMKNKRKTKENGPISPMYCLI
jgi:hypothetical protein